MHGLWTPRGLQAHGYLAVFLQCSWGQKGLKVTCSGLCGSQASGQPPRAGLSPEAGAAPVPACECPHGRGGSATQVSPSGTGSAERLLPGAGPQEG